ncbi:putative helicase MOV-10 isoform X2 [Athalia rosae]|nr:putative helicase MOV-10 isoform X2 [Athalia rosae]
MRRSSSKSCCIPTIAQMAPDLALPAYRIPKNMRKIFENRMKSFPGISSAQEALLADINNIMSKEEITADTYIQQLKLMLHIEEYEREKEMRKFDLHNQKIVKKNNEFLVHVPGLTEERPSLQLHDEVQLRQTNGRNLCYAYISFIGQNFVKVVPTTKFLQRFTEDDLYNIKFLMPRRTIQCCHYALDVVKTNQLVPAMFPEMRSIYNKSCRELFWFNEKIAENQEQKQAIHNIIARTARPAPYILFGPPGTGKTETLVEAVTQIWKTNSFNHILICTPSNAAADEILKRLLTIVPERDVHRMYGSSRSWDEVNEQIQPCANFVEREIIFLPKELIMLKRIVVVTAMSCARLWALKLRENHFSYVFIDEAGQATEPESLIPLTLVSSADSFYQGRFQGQVVIAGDPMQLGPSIAPKSMTLLGKSLLERLMKQCLPYKKDNTGKYNPNYITKLRRNFRSHKSILHVPNKLFYDNELVQCGKDAVINRALGYAHLPNNSFPLIFHGVQGQEIREKNSPSVCNMEEVGITMNYLQKLIGAKLGGRELELKDIGIVTPYKLQRTKLRQKLEEKNWDDISVGTVETFQGQERDVIIISTVRSLMCNTGTKAPLGFLSNPKRFNVAVTRAKSLLITIGHPTILKFDPCWNELMSYCMDNGAYIGDHSPSSHKLTTGEKKKLIAKKYVPPKKRAAQDFQFPDLETPEIDGSRNCVFPKNSSPRRERRMPKMIEDYIGEF